MRSEAQIFDLAGVGRSLDELRRMSREARNAYYHGSRSHDFLKKQLRNSDIADETLARENSQFEFSAQIEQLLRTMIDLSEKAQVLSGPSNGVPIKDSGEGSTMDPTTQAYIDRTMDAVRAGNDAKFTEMTSELRSIRSDLKSDIAQFQAVISKETEAVRGDLKALQASTLGRKEFWLGLAGVGVATVTLIVGTLMAALAFGGDRFDAGVGIATVLQQVQQDQASVLQQIQQDQAEQDAAQQDQLDTITTLLNQVLERESGFSPIIGPNAPEAPVVIDEPESLDR